MHIKNETNLFDKIIKRKIIKGSKTKLYAAINFKIQKIFIGDDSDALNSGS